MPGEQRLLSRLCSLVLVFIIVFSAFSITMADSKEISNSRSSRAVTELKLVIHIGDWDNDTDNPDFNITTLDQNNNRLSWVNIYGPGLPEFTQTNGSGEFIIYDQPAGQYCYHAEHWENNYQFFAKNEFIHRLPNATFIWVDLCGGPFDADFNGNGSPDDVKLQFFKTCDMNPQNDANVTFTDVKFWYGWQDPQWDLPGLKRKTNKDGIIFLKDLERDGYQLEITNNSLTAKFFFDIFYDFHLMVDGFYDMDYDGKWRDADITLYSNGEETNTVSDAKIEVWDNNFKKLICNGTTDSGGVFELREGKNNWIDNKDGLFKVKAKHNNKITIARLKIGDLFFEAYVCDNDQLGEENDVVVYIYDENGPVKDANVYLYKFGWDQVYRKSNAEGNAYFYNLPEGKHRIEVDYNGYWAPSDEIRVGSQLFYTFPEYWNEWNDEKQRDTFNLQVRVMETPDRWGGDSIENAEVAIEIKDNMEKRKTDWDGYAYYYDIPPGLYDINVSFDFNKNNSIEPEEIVIEYDFEVGEATILDINVTDLNNDGYDDICIYAHGLKGEPRMDVWLGIRCEGGDEWIWIDYNIMEGDGGFFNVTGHMGKPLPDGMYVIEYEHYGIRGKEMAFLGTGPFYHIKVKIGDYDNDNDPDEAEIKVLDGYTTLPNIEVYVDKEYQGLTDNGGIILVDNMKSGMHSIKAKKKVDDKSITIARMDRFGVGEFRYIDAWEENRWEDFGVWKYDIRISVRAWPQEFSVGAEIYFDGVLVGMTNNMGQDSLIVNSVTEGLHKIEARLAQPYASETVFTEFNAGKMERYFSARWFDANNDGIENDVELSFIEDEEPILGIEFFVDGWSVGKADFANAGKVVVYNLTPGKHNVEIQFKDYREWYDIFGGADDFIVLEARVIEMSGNYNDPEKVMVEVTVTNRANDPVPFVEITFNGRYCGQTNLTGKLLIMDIWERGPCWVDARYWMNDMEMWANTMVFIGKEDVLWVKMGHDENLDNDPKDKRNDMELEVFLYLYSAREEYPQGKPLESAEITLMGKKKGKTDSEGLFILYNLSDGQYKGFASYTDPTTNREFSWEYRFCIGDHRNFLRGDAWMQGPENRDVEIQVWVGSEWGGEEPVQGAKLFHENRYFGSTDWDGRYRAYNLEPGYYFLNITWHNEMRNCDIYGWIDFYVGGMNDFMIVDWYIEDLNDQGEENDVTYFVRNGKEEPLKGAEIYIHGPEELYGTTDETGKHQFYDLPNGYYWVDIKYVPPDMDPMMGFEQWWSCDLVIGDHGFIWVDIWIESRNGFGREDDLTIIAHGGQDRLLEGADIFIDGMYRGRTNFDGAYYEDDFHDGHHWLEVHYKDMIDGMPMDLHWGGEFFIGDVQGIIWAETYVYEEHDDGKMDDVEIKVYGGDGSSLEGAEVFVHGPNELYGRTDKSGSIKFFDLGNGYYSADISYCGIGYGGNTDMNIIHDPGSEMPTMDKITVEITYPGDNHKFTQKDNILIIEGTASTSIQGDYIEDVVMLIPGGSPDDKYRGDEMFMEYTKVPTKAIGPNGSYSKWRFEIPDNPLNSPNPDDRPPLDTAIPLYARAFDDKGGWNQAKINVMFTYLDETPTRGSRARQDSTTEENKEDMPDWITGFNAQPQPFDNYFGTPTNTDLKLSVKPDEMMKTGRLVGTFGDGVQNIELYFCFFVEEYIEWNGQTFTDGAWTNWVHMDDVDEFGMEINVEQKADGTWVWSPPHDDGTTRQTSTYEDYDDGNDGPSLLKVGVVGYDSNGSYNYIVSDKIALPKTEYDHENKGEAWTHVDFIIGESGFIFAKAYITAEDSDGKLDDIEIKVFDAEKNPIKGAEIYIWDTFIGETDEEGSIFSHDETPGLDDGYYPVDVIFRGLFECPKCGEAFKEALGEGDTCPACDHPISDFDLMVYRASTEFVIGTSDIFIKVNAYVKDIDGDGRSDDVAIRVQGLSNDPIINAKVFIDDKFIGKTDDDGYIREYNLYAGRHSVDVLTEDWYTGYTDFFSEGNGETYIYAEAFVLNMVSIGISVPTKNDVLIYVYDKTGTPLRDAEVYFNGIYQGQTTIQGFLSMFDQPEGWYAVDVFWFDDFKGKEYHGYTEFKSQGTGDNYIYSDNIVDDADENGYPDDAIIVVYDSNGDPVENARVKIDGDQVGNTSNQGGTRGFGNLGSRSTNLEMEDMSAGWHTVTVEYDEVEPFSGEVNTISSTRVIKSDGKGEDYVYANAFVTDGDNDGNKNDVKIVVSDNLGSPVANAEIVLNKETFSTDNNGLMTIHNVAEGRHTGTVMSGTLDCIFSFESMGDGGGNQVPDAEISMPEQKIQAGKEFTYTADVVDPDGDRVIVLWDFDDGSEELVGSVVTYTFEEAGEYKITVTVSDGVDRITYTEKITVASGSGSGGDGGADGALPMAGDFTMILIIVIVVVIVVIIFAGIMIKRRKGKNSSDTDDEDTKDPRVTVTKQKNAEIGTGNKLIDKVKTSTTSETSVYVKSVNQTPTPVVRSTSTIPIPTPKVQTKGPDAKTKEKDDLPKRYELYRAALKQAFDDGVITESEDNLLKMLRKKYDISEDEHKILAAEIDLERKL